MPRPSDDEAVSFGVLGPLTVLLDGEVVAVGGPKERLVVAHLLARANQVVTIDALIESLWGDHPPRSAERTLQAYVARLRGALEPARPSGADSTLLVRTGPGYRLRVTTGQVDALRFEALVRTGSQQLHDGDGGARATLRDALALWRGQPWGEFLEVEPCEAEARRLDEMRLVAIEDRVDADLAAGAASELVAELDSLVVRYEFRERLWAQLMLALYRSGRQGDALGAYRRARTVLIEQLGIEPGHELKALEAAILDQDPALDARPAGRRPFGLPPPLELVGPAFVGRDAELAWLRTAWLDAVDGRGGFVSVLGPEGIGKTRLVAELAREVQRSGGVVMYGRCGDAIGGARGLLDQAFASVAVPTDDLDGTPVSELGELVMQRLGTVSEGRPVLLAVDDVHRADLDTIEVLAELAGWSDAGALLVVATFRTDPDGPDPSVAGTGAGDSHLVLRGLDHDAMRRVCEMYDADRWWPDELDRLHELTGGIPLRVHELASDWARERSARDVGAAADRSAAAQSRLAGLRAEIAQSVESIQHVLEQRSANIAPRQTTYGATGRQFDDALRRPYKGLAAFESADASDFFGRERLVAELVARLAGARLLAVVGPSGSGKSSLVRAGLVPALAAGVLPVPGGWTAVITTPDACRRGHDPMVGVMSKPPSDRGRRLVVVDQLEELFAVGLGHDEQAAFVERLVSVADRSDCVVVVAVRADHLDRCALFPELAELMTGNDVLVGPMRDVELRRAIERPARRAGGVFEPGLVDVVIGDVAGRPGALPLLSTALAETWERRVDGVLTLAGYRSVGGVDGALANIAEQTYLALEPEQRVAARRLLMRLSDAGGDGAPDLRRSLPLAALGADHDARRAMEALVDRRLLVVDRDTVEVAHEALLREWPRLRAWMDEDVHGRQLHRHLREATQAWLASGEDPSELYRGTRLDAALDWAGTHPADVDPAEQAFLDAGKSGAAQELDDARARAAGKARDNRRLRWSLVGVAGLLVAAVAAGLLFLAQRDQAERTAREARARELASESTSAIDEDPELAMLLGLEAIETTRRAGGDPLPEAVGALQQATQAARLELRRDEAIQFLDVSPDGTRIATGSASDRGAVLVFDAVSGDVLRTLPRPYPDALAQDVLYSPDGRRLVVTYYHIDDPGPPAVIVWNGETGDQVARLPVTDDRYVFHAFSPDGRRLATVSEGGGDVNDVVTVWDVTAASKVYSLDVDGLGGPPVFLSDATLAIPEHETERIALYSAEEGTPQGEIPTPGIKPQGVALDEATGRLALGSQISRQVQIVDTSTGTVTHKIAMADVGPLDWSTDGALLAVAGGNSSPIRIFDGATGEETLVLLGHTSGSWDAGFIGGGERLASVGYGGELRLWDVTPDGPRALHAVAPPSGVATVVSLSPDGAEMIVQTLGGSVERIATQTGEVLARRTGQLVGQLPYVAAVSPDWRFVASVDEGTGEGAILDLATLTPITPLPPCTGPVVFSPDSTLLAVQGATVCAPGDGLFPAPEAATLRNRIIDVSSGREVVDLGDATIFDAAFNPEGPFPAGQYLAVNANTARVDLYDVRAQRLVASLPVDDGVWGLRFDPTGQWLVAATGGGRIWAVDVAAVVAGAPADDATVLDIVAHDSGSWFSISADGILATTGFGESVKLWDLATGESLLEFGTGRATGGSVLAFAPDGSYLIYSDGSILRRHILDTDGLVDLARSLLTRDLTAEECHHYLDEECRVTVS